MSFFVVGLFVFVHPSTLSFRIFRMLCVRFNVMFFSKWAFFFILDMLGQKSETKPKQKFTQITKQA